MPALATLSPPDRDPPRRINMVPHLGPSDPIAALHAQVDAGLADVDADLKANSAKIIACQDQQEVDRYAASIVDARLAGTAAKLSAIVRAETTVETVLAPQADALARRRDALPPYDANAVRERRPWDAAGITSLALTIAIGLIACFSGGWNVASAVLGTAGYKGAWGILPAAVLGLLICGAGALLAEMLHRVAARDPAAFEVRIRVLVTLLVTAIVCFALAFSFGFADRRTGNIASLLAAASHPSSGNLWGVLFCLSLLAIEATVSVLSHIHIQHLLRSRYRGSPPKNPEWVGLDDQIRDLRGRMADAVRHRADAEGMLHRIHAVSDSTQLNARGAWRRHRAQYGF